MKHEVNGLKIDVSFSRPELSQALLRKILKSSGLNTNDLLKLLIEDLIEDRFLRTEISVVLMDLEKEELISSEMRITKQPTETEMGIATRYYLPLKPE